RRTGTGRGSSRWVRQPSPPPSRCGRGRPPPARVPTSPCLRDAGIQRLARFYSLVVLVDVLTVGGRPTVSFWSFFGGGVPPNARYASSSPIMYLMSRP